MLRDAIVGLYQNGGHDESMPGGFTFHAEIVFLHRGK